MEASENTITTSLGEMVIRFSRLEFSLSYAIEMLLDTDGEAGMIATARLTYGGKVDVFNALALYRVPEVEGSPVHRQLIKRLGEAAEERNTTLHSLWAGSMDEPSLVRLKSQLRRTTGYQFSGVSVSAKELSVLSSRWAKLTEDLLTLDEALPDLQWLGERPGTKILIKGNHCTWWGSRKKVQAVIDPSIRLLQNDAVKMADGTVVVGGRLWDPPGAPWADQNTEKIYNREIGRLKLSIAAGEKLGGERTLALVHYPPRYTDGRVTAAVPLLEAAGVSVCVYGHLHGKDHRFGFQGEANGIRYLLTSCDAIDFRPIEISY